MDVVLVLEGDRYGALRLLRGAKNRFGSTEETGVLEMTGEGLRDVPDPARAFLGAGGAEAPGSRSRPSWRAPGPSWSRSRRSSRRRASACLGEPLVGVPADRLALLVAVLARRCGLDLSQPGPVRRASWGVRPSSEPALDLPVALALASTLAGRRRWRPGTVACGEVSLLGGLRPVQGLERRLREAARLGFRQAIVPASEDTERAGAEHRRTLRDVQLRVVAVSSLREALERSIGCRFGTFGVGSGLGGSGSLGRCTVSCDCWAAASGLILAIALTSPSATGSVFDRSAAGYVLLLVWLVAWFIAGYSVMPHITVEPARRIIASVSDLSAGEFVAAVIGLTVGLLLGLLLGLPLSNFPDPYGWLLPLGVSVVLGLGMMGLTVAKRDDLLEAARDVGLLRPPESRAPADGDAEVGRAADLRGHQRHHRRPAGRRRGIGLPGGHARRAALRARGAPAHRR